MKRLKLIHLLPVLVIAALFLSAYGYSLHGPQESVYFVQAQDTAAPTDPPISTPIVSTVIVPVTGEDNTADNTTLLMYMLIGIAGLAFLVAVVAVLTRANQAPPTDRTHTH